MRPFQADEAKRHLGGARSAGHEELKVGSRRIITASWQLQCDDYGRSRWAYLFARGLVDEPEAESWADSVWDEA